MTKLWPPIVWHAIQLYDVVNLAPESYPTLLIMAKMVHIESSDPLRSGLSLFKGFSSY